VRDRPRAVAAIARHVHVRSALCAERAVGVGGRRLVCRGRIAPVREDSRSPREPFWQNRQRPVDSVVLAGRAVLGQRVGPVHSEPVARQLRGRRAAAAGRRVCRGRCSVPLRECVRRTRLSLSHHSDVQVLDVHVQAFRDRVRVDEKVAGVLVFRVPFVVRH